ncbi:MAG: hypothetical protein ACTHLN_10365, partial [Tepidisphaeraceae bacterium]
TPVAGGSPEPIVPTNPPLVATPQVAGEVREAASMLVGHELSEEAIEANQVIEQVGTMVKENPEIAANLVKRWLNQD